MSSFSLTLSTGPLRVRTSWTVPPSPPSMLPPTHQAQSASAPWMRGAPATSAFIPMGFAQPRPQQPPATSSPSATYRHLNSHFAPHITNNGGYMSVQLPVQPMHFAAPAHSLDIPVSSMTLLTGTQADTVEQHHRHVHQQILGLHRPQQRSGSQPQHSMPPSVSAPHYQFQQYDGVLPPSPVPIIHTSLSSNGSPLPLTLVSPSYHDGINQFNFQMNSAIQQHQQQHDAMHNTQHQLNTQQNAFRQFFHPREAHHRSSSASSQQQQQHHGPTITHHMMPMALPLFLQPLRHAMPNYHHEHGHSRAASQKAVDKLPRTVVNATNIHTLSQPFNTHNNTNAQQQMTMDATQPTLHLNAQPDIAEPLKAAALSVSVSLPSDDAENKFALKSPAAVPTVAASNTPTIGGTLTDDASVPACAICLSDFVESDVVTHMPCAHPFHFDCLRPWLTKQNTCPSCRHEIETDDENYNRDLRHRQFVARWKAERDRRQRAKRIDGAAEEKIEDEPLPLTPVLPARVLGVHFDDPYMDEDDEDEDDEDEDEDEDDGVDEDDDDDDEDDDDESAVDSQFMSSHNASRRVTFHNADESIDNRDDDDSDVIEVPRPISSRANPIVISDDESDVVEQSERTRNAQTTAPEVQQYSSQLMRQDLSRLIALPSPPPLPPTSFLAESLQQQQQEERHQATVNTTLPPLSLSPLPFAPSHDYQIPPALFRSGRSAPYELEATERVAHHPNVAPINQNSQTHTTAQEPHSLFALYNSDLL